MGWAGAQPGAVVCFYPGVVYRPMHYRLMANFPRVDLTNPYLIGRFDGSLVDGKPWGYAGGDTGGTSFYPWGAMPVAARGSSGATHRPGFMERLVKFGSSMGQVRRLSARGAVCAERCVDRWALRYGSEAPRQPGRTIAVRETTKLLRGCGGEGRGVENDGKWLLSYPPSTPQADEAGWPTGMAHGAEIALAHQSILRRVHVE
jgi:hypothetical protein